MRNYDKIFYINLTQDLPPAKAEQLYLRLTPVIFIKIPPGAKLSEVTDKRLDEVTSNSKIYFCAHGTEEFSDLVTDKRSENANVYYLDSVVDFFAKIFDKPQFKNPDQISRPTLVITICEGLGFARNLQVELQKKHGIYIDVIGNKYVTHDYYSYPDEGEINIIRKETSIKGVLQEHHRPHSKVLLTIDKHGQQKEIDAYEFKWIEKVINNLKQLLNICLKWMDINNPKEIEMAQAIKTFFNDVLAAVDKDINKDISLTANLVLMMLMASLSEKADLYYPATRYNMFNLQIKELIDEGQKYINLHPNAQNELEKFLQRAREKEQETYSVESPLKNLLNHFHRLKRRYSNLLEEASLVETNREELLSEAKKIEEEMKQVKLSMQSYFKK